MDFLRWLASRLIDTQPPAGRRSKLKQRVRHYEPADEFVQQLFVEIRRGSPTERTAWIELAQYLGQDPSARPADLMRPRT